MNENSLRLRKIPFHLCRQYIMNIAIINIICRDLTRVSSSLYRILATLVTPAKAVTMSLSFHLYKLLHTLGPLDAYRQNSWCLPICCYQLRAIHRVDTSQSLSYRCNTHIVFRRNLCTKLFSILYHSSKLVNSKRFTHTA